MPLASPAFGVEYSLDHRPNVLVFQVIEALEQADASDDIEARRVYVRLAEAALQRLFDQHRDTEIALRLHSGEEIGWFSYSDFTFYRDIFFTGTDFSALEQRIDDLSTALETAQQEARRRERNYWVVIQQNRSLQSNLSDMEANLNPLIRQNQDLNTRIEQYQDTIRTSEQDIRALNTLNQALRDAVTGDAAKVLFDERGYVRIQSELLFPSGTADLQPSGEARLSQFADHIQLPLLNLDENVDWLLRVEAHTDRRPINNEHFASNWELSVARAVSVVKFLEGTGVPSNRLAAAGYADYQPVDPRETLAAYATNRRIEIHMELRPAE